MKTIIIISIAITLFSACNNKSEVSNSEAIPISNTVELTATQFKNSKISLGKIEKKPISSRLKLNGKIDVPPQNLVSVSVPLGGYLKSTKLIEGMHVNKGDVLTILEDQQYIQLQQDYLTAKTRLSLLEKDFLRQKGLNESKASSDKVFEIANAEYVSQKVLLKSLSEKLKLISIDPNELNENTISRSIKIYSPINGFVSSVKMNTGRYANPTDVLFELVDPTTVHLVLTAYDKDLEKLFIGQKVVAYTNNQSSKKYDFEILYIGKDISNTGTTTVHCHFIQKNNNFIPGMYMNAEVEITAENAFVIPVEGLVSYEGKEYVFTQTETNKYQMLEVTSQNTENGLTQITFSDSIEISNSVFVTSGAYTLLMKMKNTSEE
jgi:cobalt-zinc-cadmium efflux system membrane fusion protein